MPSDLETGDDDYIDDPEELDPTVFHIWDPLQKPVTLQYTAEQLHGRPGLLVTARTSNIRDLCRDDPRR
jgi:hypothetical protein